MNAPPGPELRLAAHDFLVAEAEALDERRYRDWLELLTEDVRYRMPVRVTVHGGGVSALADMSHFDEDRYTLGKRVERLSGEHAWTEDPPSRVRRFVTNVRCAPGPAEGEIAVRSYLLLFRSRSDPPTARRTSRRSADTHSGGRVSPRLRNSSR